MSEENKPNAPDVTTSIIVKNGDEDGYTSRGIKPGEGIIVSDGKGHCYTVKGVAIDAGAKKAGLALVNEEGVKVEMVDFAFFQNLDFLFKNCSSPAGSSEESEEKDAGEDKGEKKGEEGDGE